MNGIGFRCTNMDDLLSFGAIRVGVVEDFGSEATELDARSSVCIESVT